MTTFNSAWRRDLVSYLEAASFPCNKIDSQFLMSERGAQRAGQIEVPTAGFGIDVGGTAAAIATVDPKQPASDPDIAAHPIEFLPRPCAIDIEICPKPQRIDLDPPFFLEAPHRGQIDQ